MAWLIDQEIQKLLNEAESRSNEILLDNREALDSLAGALLKEEILDKADIEKIILESKQKGTRPGTAE
jgi:cell division protease FtsH